MRSPDWDSTAIFLAWDDWGGFYDHVAAADGRRERLRAARAGDGDQPVREAGLHRPPDAELRRLRQVHRGRLPRRAAPRPRDRRPARPAARRARGRRRSSATSTNDFDFNQAPRPPVILPVHPHDDAHRHAVGRRAGSRGKRGDTGRPRWLASGMRVRSAATPARVGALDGLRGLAVTAVVVNHLRPNALRAAGSASTCSSSSRAT